MPRFVSRSYTVEAYQYTGSTANLPLSFAECVSARRMGDGGEVRTAAGWLPCAVGDWLLRAADGRVEVMPPGVFDARFEQLHTPPVAGYLSGLTATFIGAPGELLNEMPNYVDWLGLRFPRGEPVPVSEPSSIEALMNNSQFVVSVADAVPLGEAAAATRTVRRGRPPRVHADRLTNSSNEGQSYD